MARCLVLTKLPSAERKGLYFSLQVYKLIKDYLTERNEMFMTAIEVVLHDEGFDFPSDSAKNARKTASDLLPWCKDDVNIEALTSFVTEIFALFDRCIDCSKRKVSHSKHVEKIWGSFHRERCMPAYASSWSTFLEISINTTISADPIFFQFITDHMFKTTAELLHYLFNIIQTHQLASTAYLSPFFLHLYISDKLGKVTALTPHPFLRAQVKFPILCTLSTCL